MQHRYRPTIGGLFIWVYAAYFGSLAYRWTLNGALGDGVGALLFAVGMAWLGWRMDRRPAVVSSE